MIILGIDPGYAIVGYGVVQAERGRFLSRGHGVIRTEAGIPIHLRISEIYNDMCEILQTVRPDCIAIEKLFFTNNKTTGIDVAQARGAILLAVAQSGLPYYEYTPSEVKTAVVGYGKADKHQMMELTRIQLGLSEIPRPDDAADALAIALCHARSATSVFSQI
ncbi:MAG: crossover junction endodeoxyribonuclease RuvC [Clostridia bacterium]|nr:crossover junction endodeoxyribonuclease RuvC [Clostridia bacterium]